LTDKVIRPAFLLKGCLNAFYKRYNSNVAGVVFVKRKLPVIRSSGSVRYQNQKPIMTFTKYRNSGGLLFAIRILATNNLKFSYAKLHYSNSKKS